MSICINQGKLGTVLRASNFKKNASQRHHLLLK
jgi:hypothetical protein